MGRAKPSALPLPHNLLGSSISGAAQAPRRRPPARGLSWAVMTFVSAGPAPEHPQRLPLCSVLLELEAAQMTATIIGLLCVVLVAGVVLVTRVWARIVAPTTAFQLPRAYDGCAGVLAGG